MPDDASSGEQLALKLTADPDDIQDLKGYVDRHFDYMQKVREAAELYLKRKARSAHPEGVWKQRRWFPAGDEVQPCCKNIYAPTDEFPYTLMVHCRTLVHVCNLKKVLAKDVRKALQRSI